MSESVYHFDLSFQVSNKFLKQLQLMKRTLKRSRDCDKRGNMANSLLTFLFLQLFSVIEHEGNVQETMELWMKLLQKLQNKDLSKVITRAFTKKTRVV